MDTTNKKGCLKSWAYPSSRPKRVRRRLCEGGRTERRDISWKGREYKRDISPLRPSSKTRRDYGRDDAVRLLLICKMH